MGFFRDQEKKLAIRYLNWQYEKKKIVPPSPEELDQYAGRIVDEAHCIAKKRGRNVVSIIKELADDLKQDKRE